MRRPLVFDIDHYITSHVTYNQTTMPRRTVLILVTLLGLPLLGLAALFFLVNPEQLRPVVESQLSDALQRPVRLGNLRFRVFPLSLSAEKLEIAEDPAFGTAPFATAAGLSVHPRLLPLLRGQIVIDRLSLQSPQVALRQNAAQHWNYQSLGRRSSSSSSPLELGELSITDATLRVHTLDAGRPVTDEYQRLSLSLQNFRTGQPFTLALKARTAAGAELGASGTVALAGPTTTLRQIALQFAGLQGQLDGQLSSDSLNLKIEIPSSPLAQAAPLFLPADTKVQGQISAQIQATGSPRAPQLTGKVAITGFEASGGQIKQPVRTPNLALELTPQRLSLLPASITSGSTQLQLYGVVSQYQSNPTLEATLLAPQAQLEELLAIARAYGLLSSADVSGTGQLRLQLRAHGPLRGATPLRFAGNGLLQSASLTLPSLTKPLAVSQANFQFAEDSVSLENIAASLGSTQATGSLQLANFRSPRASFNLKANRLSLTELRSWTRSEPSSSSQPLRLQAQGSLEIGHLDLNNIVLERLTAQCSFRDGQLALRPLRASMYGGTHTGSLEIDTRPTPPVYHLESRLEKIESSDLLAAATALRGVLSGPLSSDLDLRFSPGEPAALGQSLNGTLSLRLDQGRLAGFNLTNELAAVAQFLGYSASPSKFTQFRALSGDLNIQNGRAQTQNLTLDMEHINSTVSGTINLADQSLDLKILNVLDSSFSNQVGGNRIGGFMTAALSNGRGGLLIPATLKGTFQKPQMAPDAGAIAKLKLQSLNPANPKQVMDQVESVLGIFRKKK